MGIQKIKMQDELAILDFRQVTKFKNNIICLQHIVVLQAISTSYHAEAISL